MPTLFNDAGKTALADGVALTASNTNGGGNTLLTPSGTSIVKRIGSGDRSPAVTDTASYEISAQTATAASVALPTAGTYTAATGGGCGGWFLFAGIPTVSTTLLRFGNSGLHYVGFNTAGKLWLTVNGTIMYTTTLVLLLNRWYWISHSLMSSATVGVARFGLRDSFGVSLDSYSTPATQDTSAVVNATATFGKMTTSGNMALMRLAGLRTNNTSNNFLVPPTARGRGMEIAA